MPDTRTAAASRQPAKDSEAHPSTVKQGEEGTNPRFLRRKETRDVQGEAWTGVAMTPPNSMQEHRTRMWRAQLRFQYLKLSKTSWLLWQTASMRGWTNWRNVRTITADRNRPHRGGGGTLTCHMVRPMNANRGTNTDTDRDL